MPNLTPTLAFLRAPRSVSPERSGATGWLAWWPLIPAAVIVIVVLVIVVVLLSSGGEPPPATGAATVVPADALMYVHLSTDPTRPAVRRAQVLSRRFPDYSLLAGALLRRLGASVAGSGSGDVVQEIRPWLGQEAAFTLLNTPSTTAGSLIVLDVKSRSRARAFLARAGAYAVGTYRRTELLRYRSGVELAFVKHYLAVGQDASVREAIDAASGHSPALGSSSTFKTAAGDEPAGRVLDAYASVEGVRRVLGARAGVLGMLGVLLNHPALAGTALSLSAVSGGAQIYIHNALDPNLARLNGSRPTAFTPTLQTTIPASSMLLFDVSGLDRVAPRILEAGAAGGIGARIGPLLSRLGAALAAEGINVQNIVSIFKGETAVAIASYGAAPSLLIVARTPHPSSTRDTLAALEAPLAQLFPAPSSGPGQAPEFNDVPVAGVTAHQLALAPGLQLNYAVFDGLVVVSTSINGIAAVAGHHRSLAADSLFNGTLSDRPDEVTSLLFLDFSQLLSLGEQTGLMRSARSRALLPDLQRIRAIGLHSTSGETDSTAELFLKIP